jgi:hypothetical protein
MGLGRWSAGRGGDRNSQLSTVPGATTTWPGFEGQIAKFSLYAAPLVATTSPVTGPGLKITDIVYDQESDRISLTWNARSGAVYGVYASPDGQDWSLEIDDSVTAIEDTVTFTFNNPTPGLERQFFRVVEF